MAKSMPKMLQQKMCLSCQKSLFLIKAPTNVVVQRLYSKIAYKDKVDSKLDIIKERQNVIEQVLSASNQVRCKGRMPSVTPVRPSDHSLRKKPESAAVLVTMCTIKSVPSFLFTVRSTNLNSHRGEISFPGGKADFTDSDLVETALREAREEIGMDTSKVEIWGELSGVPNRDYKMLVTPIIANCGEIDINSLQCNQKEVSKVFTRSIDTLVQPGSYGYTTFRAASGPFLTYSLPVYPDKEHRIWGLTGIILHQALTILLPDVYTLKLPKLVQKKSKKARK